MKSGFSFELYETIFENCFINSSKYKNGNLQLSLFGTDPTISEVQHFADITLEQYNKILKNNEIVVDCKYKPTLIPQLIKLGILKQQVGVYVEGCNLYPIYIIDLDKCKENYYCMQVLNAA